MKPTPQFKIHTAFSGRFKISVVKKDGSERFPLGKGWHKNLILNSGLDHFFTQSGLGYVTAACRIGTGTTPANVADTALVNQVKTSTTYNAGSGANGVTYNSGTGAAVFKRTFDFTTESGSVGYNEIGIAPLITGNLFSRIVLGSTATVAAGESLRVVYELTATVSQIVTSTPTSNTSGTFDANGDIKFVGALSNIFGNINANGTVITSGLDATYAGSVLNGNITVYSAAGNTGQLFAILTTTSAFPSVGSDPTGTVLTTTPAGKNLALGSTTDVTETAYSAGSFIKDSFWTFTAANPGGTVTNVRSVGLSPYTGFAAASGRVRLAVIFDADQTKGGDYKLTFGFRWTAGRS